MEITVRGVMTEAPISIAPSASALAVFDLMLENGIHHVPVLDEEARVIGVVSFEDLRAAFPIPVRLRCPPSAAEREELKGSTAGDVMSSAPVTIAADSSLREAAEHMVARRIGCLPVVDEAQHLQGIITETDLLQALVAVLWSEELFNDRHRGVEFDALVSSLRDEHRRLTEQLGVYDEIERGIVVAGQDTPQDTAEAGLDAEDTRLTERLAQVATRRLQALERALERAAKGKLTQCERCGGQIPMARLRAAPEATLCVRCSRRVEGL
jgi:acetoin utilization protein AcuB